MTPHPTEPQGERPVRRYAVTKGFENDNGDFVKLADYRTLERALSECRRELEKLRTAHDLGWAHKKCPVCDADMMTESRLASHAEREGAEPYTPKLKASDYHDDFRVADYPAPSPTDGLALNPITNEPWDDWEIESLICHLRNPENAPWLAGWSPMQVKLMIAGLSALRSHQAQGDSRDAERYRWLRSEEVCTNPRYYEFWNRFLESKLVREESMDALIDAAMSQQEKRDG